MRTTLTVSVHQPDTNPMYGLVSTHVSIDDEGGGGYVVLQQHDDVCEPGKIRLDLEELEEIVEVARALMRQAFLKPEGLPLA